MLYAVRVHSAGRVQRVVLDAPSAQEAARAAWRRFGAGTFLLSVQPAERPGARAGGGVGPRDLEMFCRQVEVLLRAGVTVQEALEDLSREAGRKVLSSALRAVSESVRAGSSLSASLRAHPRVFPAAFCQAVAAAEEAGALPEALERLAVHFGREASFREKLRQALTYPAVVFCLALAVTGGMFGFVVPRFASLLQGAGVPLPGITHFVLAVSGRLPQIGLFLGACILAALAASRAARSGGALRGAWERAVLRLPVVGRISSRSAAARACRNLALLLESGTPVTRALETAAKTAGLSLLSADLERARAAVQAGGSLAAGLEGSRFFSPAARRMVAVGEGSGQLPGMLQQAAALFEMEVDALMQRLPPLVETGMLLVVGGNVAFVMLSLFLPIVSLYKAVQK
ncbi:MAG: type II secretion system F family protein [Bacillota bacterium]|nr:type II secretion system F family protein [Bacillota bacterium]